MSCAPLRILSNELNLIRTATLTPSSVKPVSGTVIPVPASRDGSASVDLTGEYTGTENVTVDVEIVDIDVTVKLPSATVFNGSGSGTLTDIEATSFPAQSVTVELKDAGIPILAASLDFEGVKIVARETGADGNNIRINIDQSGLTFTAQTFSLLEDLKAGQGGEQTGLAGSAFEWDTAVMGADGIIPDTAHRITFSDNTLDIYLQYKTFEANVWQYHFVPALLRDVPRGSVVKFVTGGRDVSIIDATTSPAVVEVYPDNETVYDLLHQIKEQSALVKITGVVAFDRSPTGQASRELLARTDAHTEPSHGTGSVYATGFSAAFATADAATENIIATCFASSNKDHPLARLGAERWQVKSTLRGLLADAVTGVAYLGDTFGFLIPQKFPPGYGSQHGNYSAKYQPNVRNANEPDAPPVCIALAPLGAAAVDQTITLTYSARPSGTCDCAGMPQPAFSRFCLGIDIGEGDGSMSYSADTIARLTALFNWYAGIVRANSNHGTGRGDYDQPPLISNPITRRATSPLYEEPVVQTDLVEVSVNLINEDGATQTITGTNTLRPLFEQSGVSMLASTRLVDPAQFIRNAVSYVPFSTETLTAMIGRFEAALAEIDALDPGTLKTAGEAAWDTAVAEMEADVEAQLTPSTSYELFGNAIADPEVGLAVEASENIAAGDLVLVYRQPGTAESLLVRKWVPGITGAKGFSPGAITSGVSGGGTIIFVGPNAAAVGEAALVPGSTYAGSPTTPGKYVIAATPPVNLVGPATTTSEVNHLLENSGLTINGGAQNRLAILADRYRSRLEWVSMSGGISHLGKADASTALESGDGCWRDTNAQAWWVAEGSIGGAYAPAFTNETYYSSKPAGTHGRFYSTHEFGFRVQVQPACESRLKLGDQIIITIGDSAWPPTYQNGDELVLPIVAAGDMHLAGGQDGNTIQQWNPTGSSSGPLAVYSLDTAAPTPYVASGLTFAINQGAIPFVIGDKFAFAIEGGHYKWRVNEGAWNISSPPDPIPAGPVLLYEGLSVTFTPGNAGSFVPGDRYSFKILQPRAASNIETPGPESWQWDGGDPELLFDLGSERTINDLALALHNLPEGATITVDGSADIGSPFTPDWTETLTWREGPLYKFLDAPQTARYLRLTIGNAPDAMIGWFFAGTAVTTTLTADLQVAKEWKINRGDGGLFGGGRYVGKRVNGTLEYTEDALSEADVIDLDAAFDWSKVHDDEPMLMIQNPSRPERAFMGRVAVDEVTWIGEFGDAGVERRFSMRAPISGVYY